MDDQVTVKQKLFHQVIEMIDERITNANKALNEIRESRNNETKSSAGDKHETGRAMLQIEEDNSQVILNNALELKNEMLKIDGSKKQEAVTIGSLVLTNNGNYLVSVGLGKLLSDNNIYYAISPSSPLGSELLNRALGDTFEFRGIKYKIISII